MNESNNIHKSSTIMKKIKEFFHKDMVKDIMFDVTLMSSTILAVQGIKFFTDKEVSEQEQIMIDEFKAIAPDLNKKYTINNREIFDSLYQEALPLIQMSMLPTECLVLKPYSDNGKTINTIGEGCYYVPENGDPQNPQWILTQKYVQQHPQISVTGDKAMALVDGVFSAMDYGAIKHRSRRSI